MSFDERWLGAAIPDTYDQRKKAREALLSAPTLYERTGDVNDANTLLVNRSELRVALGMAEPEPPDEREARLKQALVEVFGWGKPSVGVTAPVSLDAQAEAAYMAVRMGRQAWADLPYSVQHYWRSIAAAISATGVPQP